MIVTITDDFDLKRIADSGQCFRFNEVSRDGELGRYSVAAGNSHVFVKELGQDRYEFDCSEDEFENFWKRYFDLDLSYSDIRGRIKKKKDYLNYGPLKKILKRPQKIIVNGILLVDLFLCYLFFYCNYLQFGLVF